MAQKTFTIGDFNISTSWVYTAYHYDDEETSRYDLTTKPSVVKTDKSFKISGIDASTITSITLTWDVSASLTGSPVKPTASGLGYGSAKVYPGTQNSSGGVKASAGTLTGLTSHLSGDTVTCRFYYNPVVKDVVYNDTSYGVGHCTGAVYFKNVTLTVTYGSASSSTSGNGRDLWIGVGDVARRAKNMYIGVNNVAKKVKAAWIGVGGVARLCYKAATVLAATASVYRNKSNIYTSGTTLNVYEIVDGGNSGEGYAAIKFEASDKIASFTKATLYLYIIDGGSSNTKIYLYPRSGGADWFSHYNCSLNSDYKISYTNTTAGLHAYDITTDLKALYADDSSIATKGVKVYLRCAEDNLIQVAGHAHATYSMRPYIELE